MPVHASEIAAFLREHEGDITNAWAQCIAPFSDDEALPFLLRSELSAILGQVASHLETRASGPLCDNDAASETRRLAYRLNATPEPARRDRGAREWIALRQAIERVLRSTADPSVPERLFEIESAIECARLERALRLAGERWNALCRATADLVFSTDAFGRLLEDAISLRSFTGQSFAEARELGWLEAVRAEDRERARNCFRRCRDGSDVAEAEVWLRNADGRARRMTLRVAALRGRYGDLYGCVAAATDVTDRVLRERAERLLAATGAALTASLDEERVLADVMRLTLPDLADWCVADLVAEAPSTRRVRVACRDGSDGLAEEIAAMVDEGRFGPLPAGSSYPREPLLFSELPEEFSARWARAWPTLRASDELRPRAAMVVPLVVHGRLLGAWTFFRSGREPPYEPRELDVARELASRLAIAIDNARLYQAAREAIRARDEVLSTVAHDLRNPLSAISVSVHTLQARIPPEAKKEHRALDAVSRGVERVTQLVSDLLDERTIESGRLSVEFQSCSAELLVRHAAEANRARLEGASLRLELELELELPRVLADANRIAQVFDNLIGNAVKFTPNGKKVRIGAARAGGFVHFWVADEGHGILPDDLPRIFDRYWKVHRADRRGAGLGLSICKGIVEAHGGKIWAESAPECGSTLHFTLLATESGGL